MSEKAKRLRLHLHVYGPLQTESGGWGYQWETNHGRVVCCGHAPVGSQEQARVYAEHHLEHGAEP